MKYIVIYFLILNLVNFVLCIIPAVPINLNFTHDETWAINELDDLWSQVDEEIPLQEREELEKQGVQISWDSLLNKLDSLHGLIKRSNSYKNYPVIFNKSLIKHNSQRDEEEEEEYDLGDKEYPQLRKIYSNYEKIEPFMIDDSNLKKRSVSSPSSVDDEGNYPYDYQAFKLEYYMNVEKKMKSNQTLNYTEEGKPEENVQDAINKIIDIKVPKNCSAVEDKEIGLGAIRCLAKEKKRDQRWVKHFFRLLWVWMLIWAVVATCCWCRWGICCCCIGWCWPLCRPRRVIYQLQNYLSANPPGVAVKREQILNYEPSEYEQQNYKKIMRLLQRL